MTMKRISIIFLWLAVSIFPAQLNGPKIEVNITQYNFGEITEGVIVKFSFEVKNAGDQLLHINDVMTSCGCTAAVLENYDLEPGEKTAIKVEFDSEGKQGLQHKVVAVASNDASNPSIKLEITGNVLPKEGDSTVAKIIGPKIRFENTVHDFGKIKEGSVVDYTFKFKNVGSDVLEIKTVRTSCGCTAAVVSGKSIKPGEEGNLKVEFDSTKKEGVVTRTITLSSNDPVEQQKVLTIIAFVEK